MATARIFLGLSMVSVISGCETLSTVSKTVSVGNSVLLPCSCSQIDKGFKWQLEGKTWMFKYNGSVPSTSDKYNGRVHMFPSDCSVLLTNVKMEDQGEYRCQFKRDGRYNYSCVNLTVSEAVPTPSKSVLNSGSSSMSSRYSETMLLAILFGFFLQFHILD